MSKIISIVIFLVIFALAGFFRLYGVNWDQSQHLHPDERFLTMVTGAIDWPENLFGYLDASLSPLNPHNRGYNFFVYGTFPIFFTKYIAESVSQADYNGITLVGRRLSALFDLGTVILVFLTVKQIFGSKKFAFLPHLAMLLYASSVLPVQLSHFYAVDSYLTFFITLSFYLLTGILTSGFGIIKVILLGISLGLAVASKISAVYFLPVIFLGLVYFLVTRKNLPEFLLIAFLLAFFGFLTVRFAQPYLFSEPSIFTFKLNPKILANWRELKSFDNPNSFFPPGVQWIKTKPYIFPLKNILLWGLGLPLGLLSLSAIIFRFAVLLKQIYTKKISKLFSVQNLILNLCLIWIFILFIYQGSQFVKALRYFYAIYPFLTILSAWFTYKIFSLLKRNKYSFIFVFCYLLSVLIYPVSFSSIYSRLNTRVAASHWIYQNIPPGSRISGEHWDDFLPMSLPGQGLIHEKYQGVEFPLYHDDTPEKWRQMNDKLKNIDYIILTSNRLYGSIMTVPEKFPVTYKYYQSLFDGSLGFAKVAEFTSRPNLPLPFIKTCLTPPFARYGFVAINSQDCPLSGISFVDDYADETFTVYDHPKVLVFKKIKAVDYSKLLNVR